MERQPTDQPNVGIHLSTGGTRLACLLGLYFGIHLLLRLALSPSLIPDEADVALFSQSLALGYSEQPPLYSWLVWGFVQLCGLSVFSLTLVKLAILASVFFSVHVVARQVIRDERLIPLTVLSLFLLPTFAWNSVNYLTHTLLLCTVSLATVYHVLRLPQQPGLRSYLWLGLFLGLGILSKYNYVVFAFSLLLAGLCCRRYRVALLDWRLGLTALVALLVIAPHLVWALNHQEQIWGILSTKTGVGSGGSWSGIRTGLFNLLISNVFLLLLPLVGCLFLFLRPPSVWRHRPLSEPGRFLATFFLMALLLLSLQVVIGGTRRFHERWLQPFVLLVPIYCFSRLEGVNLLPCRVRRFQLLQGAFALAVTLGQGAKIWLGSIDDGVYPLQMNLRQASQHLSEAGFEHATVVASDRVIGGNLCLCFPEARVFCAWHPGYHPPHPSDERPCYAIWNARMGPVMPRMIEKYLSESGWESLTPAGPAQVVTIPPLKPGRSVNQFMYIRLLPPTAARSSGREKGEGDS